MDHCHQPIEVSISPFLQISSLGLLWMFFHCVPMCGPILAGLQLKSSTEFFLYQSGRAQMYAIFGGLAGVLGASLFTTSFLGWLPPALIFILMLFEIFPKLQSQFRFGPAWLSHQVTLQRNHNAFRRAYSLGIIFSLLPCSLVFWALTLAAGTKSFWLGAGVMLFFVAMSVIPLFVFQIGIQRGFSRFAKKWTPVLLGISFFWTTMIYLASIDIVQHRMWNIQLGERSFMLMLW